MSQIFRQANNNIPPSDLEILIFPELKSPVIHESESKIEGLLHLNNTYNIPLLNPDSYIINNIQRFATKFITSKDASSSEASQLEKLEAKFEELKDSGEKKQRFLYYFFIRLLWNCSIMSHYDHVILKIVNYRDFVIETSLADSENTCIFKLSDLHQYITNLKKVEYAISRILSSRKNTTYLNEKPALYYPIYFSKLNKNYLNKFLLVKADWANGDSFRTIAKYDAFKIDYYKTKIDALLKDKLLIKHLIQSFYFVTPNKINRRNLRGIYKIVAKNKLFKLIAKIIKKLLLRRRILWLNIRINMVRHHTALYLIGKDYKIYRKRVALTYVSQTNKYSLNKRKKKKLNAKYIKCVEFFYDRKHMCKIRRVLYKIYKINLHLRYFVHRFASKLIKKKTTLFDRRFVVPLNSKKLTYDQILDKLLVSKGNIKQRIFNNIIFSYKHRLEKTLLSNLQIRRQKSLERYIKIMEREKYYVNHRKSKFKPKLKRWLMKHVNDELNAEFCEYFSRPRVILEKREAEVEMNYPYAMSKALPFQRDLDLASFKRKKHNKFHIIKLTKPWIILQSQFFKYKGSNTVSRNLLRNKLKNRLAVPERIERITRSCKQFYTNLLKGNRYESFINLITRLKAFFLFKPELKRNQKYIFLYLLSSLIGPLYNGIYEEREYANDLHTFLTHYLIRIRPYRRYDATNLVEDLRTGYVSPKRYNLRYLTRFFKKAKNIVRKRPNYTVVKFMHRRSLKRLTIRIRSKIAVARGLLPLFKYNLVATDLCSPINIKKRFKNKGYHYLFQPDVNKKAKAKYKYYITALKKTFGYSTTYHTNARLYYFSPFNLFLKNPDDINLALADGVAKYKEVIKTKNI